MEDCFNVLLEAIKSTIKKEAPELLEVEIFGGGFNGPNDAKKFTTSAPSARVGLSAINQTLNTNSGQLEATMELNLVFITKDITVPGSRHKIALSILEKLLLLIKDGSWGAPDTFTTERASVAANNFYGPELFEQDIAMWLITWQQKCLLGKDRFKDDGSLPNTAIITTKTSNNIIEEVNLNVKPN